MTDAELNGEQAEVEEVVETPEVETEAPAGGEAEKSGEQPQTKSEIETLALEMGWDANKSKSAAQWIRDGSVIQRELKAKNDAKERDFQQRLDRLDRTNQTALKHQREQIDAAWNIRMREAVNLADMEAFDKAQKGKDAALKKFDDEVEELPAASGRQPDAAPPEVKDFAKRNSWFDVDPTLTDVAVGISNRLLSKYPNMPLAERLEQVEAEIKREFPHKFNSQGEAKTITAKPPAVEGGLRAIKTTVKKDYNALPPEAKAACAKFMRDGIFKDKEAYATKYWEQE